VNPENEEDEAETGWLRGSSVTPCLACLRKKEKKMKRILLTVLLVGLLAGQASAGMYTLDRDTAKLFTQQNTPNAANQLYLSIDWPGTSGSTINYSIDPSVYDEYGEPMDFAVGFVGNLSSTQIMKIGMLGDLPGNDGTSVDSFGVFVANDDNNDPWGVRLYLNGVSYAVPSFTTLAPGAHEFVTVSFTPGTVTAFGFEVDYPAGTGSDNFHLSVVPIPAALILGLLGMGVAGLKLRRFA
jgi:hypothetical protein